MSEDQKPADNPASSSSVCYVPNTSVMTVSNLLDRMAAERGTLVCSGDCTIVEISEARADCRFAVMNDGIGFVYRPRVTTEESLRIIADAPITKELKKLREYKAAIDRGGWDISPCRLCNELVVCIPDGLPMCESCGTSEGT